MPNAFRLSALLLAPGLLACVGTGPVTPPMFSGQVTEVERVPATTHEVSLPTFSGRGLLLTVPIPEHYSVTLQTPTGTPLQILSSKELQAGSCVGLYLTKEELEDRPILKPHQIKELPSSWCRHQ